MLPDQPLSQQVKAEDPAGVAPRGAGVWAGATQPGLRLARQPVELVPSSADSCQGKQGRCGAPGGPVLNRVRLPDGFSLQSCLQLA